MKTNNEIKKFLSGLKTNVDILDYIDVEKIDAENAFESICEMIEENGGFDKEVIYYSNAIKFLAENDPSFRESLELAAEFGYSAKDLNSEILASLLASKLAREEFQEFESEINDFFDKLNEDKE